MSSEKSNLPMKTARRPRKTGLFSNDDSVFSVDDIDNVSVNRQNGRRGARGGSRGKNSSRSRSRSGSRSRSPKRNGSNSPRRKRKSSKSPAKKAAAARKSPGRKRRSGSASPRGSPKGRARAVKSASPGGRKRKSVAEKTAANRKASGASINFEIYLRKILKQHFAAFSLGQDSVNYLNSCLADIGSEIVKNAISQMTNAGRSTIMEDDIRTVVKLKYSKIFSEADSYANKAVSSYDNIKSRGKSGTKTTRAANRTEETKAGLILKVSRVRKIIENNVADNVRKSANAIVYLTAVLEKIIELTFQQAVAIIANNDRKRVQQKDLHTAISLSDSLRQVYVD